jgi:cellulose synthase/poly-beta-1,6-N-acetylglucosamine synthase-like glycosyltransferase
MDPLMFDRDVLAEAAPTAGAGAIPLVAEPDAERAAEARAPQDPQLRHPRVARRVRVDGKFLTVDGKRFWVKGVTYGTFTPNSHGEPYPEIAKLKDDFARMRDAGVNTVRLYSPPSDRIADAAADAELHLVPDICWGPRFCELHREQDLKAIYDWTRGHARRLAGHPAMLMYSIGNEIPPLIVRWYGRARIERFLFNLNEIVKAEASDALVTYACHPPTEHLHLPFLDVVSFNVYLEREPEFRRYLARLQNLAGERPLLLSEIGLDSSGNGETEQARALDWQLRATFESGLCGATVYSWTDEWGIFKEPIAGWSFGLVDGDRKPKLALDTVRQLYKSDLYALRPAWPKVSVVVCSYNGGATLEGCLRSLSRLNYPNYETLVIDDGSTDDTSAIAQRFPVRCIRTENGGLSRARNLGISESTGEIVAFIDADAFADRDWLFHMVTALENHNAAAVGGPNLSPQGDGFLAHCVDHAPGNPTHVLVDDQFAEHVPGCNIACRKDALLAIGCFDAVHRTAGDDVDVCWKLLARDQRIAFAPGAVVWHHRRPTLAAFLKQQRGYGFAEAHLRQRYPSRFNVFGYAVWSGGIYDPAHHGLRMDGVPRVMRPLVYQGRFGGAQFQSLYQPFHAWWFQIFTTVEWQALTVCALLAGALSAAFASPWLAVAMFVATGVMLAITACAAGACGWRAVRAEQWTGRKALVGGGIVALLQVLQPLARAHGWFRGVFADSNQKVEWPVEQKLWGNLTDRDHWLTRLLQHVRDCGWRGETGCNFSDADIVLHGPGPCRLELTSVAEERLEKNWFFVRFRITAKRKWWATPLALALACAVAGLAFVPTLLPLAIPLIVALRYLLGAEAAMTRAFAQMAMEIAEVKRLPKCVGEEFLP